MSRKKPIAAAVEEPVVVAQIEPTVEPEVVAPTEEQEQPPVATSEQEPAAPASERPVQLVRRVLKQMLASTPPASRSAIIAECVKQGCNLHTAKTQYQKWYKNP